MEEYRLDVYIQNLGLTKTREKAKQLILEGNVSVNDKISMKPSHKVSEKDCIRILSNFEYVGRGAAKLEKAVNFFKISTDDKCAIDIGASTGGFTDYLIKNNARKVYAVDVGHNQLHESLINDSRVINLEGTNFRYVDTSIFKESIDLITVDVSFISLNLILPKIAEIINNNTDVIILIKPQFEAGRENIGKNGVVRDAKTHVNVLKNIDMFAKSNLLFLMNITFSPIKGGDGNIEYLGHIKRAKDQPSILDEKKFKSIVTEAFEYYKKNK